MLDENRRQIEMVQSIVDAVPGAEIDLYNTVSIRCGMCGLSYQSAPDGYMNLPLLLDEHMKTAHPEVDDVMGSCDHCGKLFGSIPDASGLQRVAQHIQQDHRAAIEAEIEAMRRR